MNHHHHLEEARGLLDLYADYLLSTSRQATATGLADLLENRISHDKITRFLSERKKTSGDLWRMVKPCVRKIETRSGVLVIDDSIEEKPYTDENDLICWHYNSSTGSQVKGINFITALYEVPGISLPVGFALVTKSKEFKDEKTGLMKRKSDRSKNQFFQDLTRQAVNHQIQFRYIINDVWYASAKNMMFVKHKLKKDFVMPMKCNRKIAFSLRDKNHGLYQAVETLDLKPGTVKEIYLEQVDFKMNLIKQVFTNKGGSHGVLYLISSDTTLDYESIKALYHRRWRVEEYHKSLKQNASLEKSPTQTVTTQSNHFFASLYAYIKLESLKVKTSMNHFALKSRIYLAGLRSAWEELKNMEFNFNLQKVTFA